jgi:hypothetical protein
VLSSFDVSNGLCSTSRDGAGSRSTDLRRAVMMTTGIASVHLGHHEIEQDEARWRACLQPIERRLTGCDRGDPVTVVVQKQLQRLAQIGVVVDDENVPGHPDLGISTVNADPASTSLRTEIEPPIASTSCREIHRPSPRPP